MTEASKNGIFAFDHFKLDVGKLMLYRDGEEILIPAKIAKTLAVLVENAGSILSYNELIDRVWEDSIVEDSNLTHYIYVLRKTLGTMPDGRPYIETLRRRGYRFHGAVRVEDPTPVPLAQFTNPPAAMPPVIHGIEREGNVLRVVEWTPLKIEDEEPKRVAEVSVRRSFPSTVITAIAIVALGLTVV